MPPVKGTGVTLEPSRFIRNRLVAGFTVRLEVNASLVKAGVPESPQPPVTATVAKVSAARRVSWAFFIFLLREFLSYLVWTRARRLPLGRTYVAYCQFRTGCGRTC